MDPIGYLVGVKLTRDHVMSARPDAPVVPDRPRRHRVQELRLAAASTLRHVAQWVEPTPQTCQIAR